MTSAAAPAVITELTHVPTDPPDPGGGGRHLPALDGLRGLAVLAVLLDHLFTADVTGVRGLDLAYRVLSAGWVGVDLFFVLSGFLITSILLRAKGRPHYFRNFYARRTLRIFPLYFGLLAVGWVAARVAHLPLADEPYGFDRNQAWLWTYLTNYRIAYLNEVIAFIVGPFAYPHFWSLAVEEHFYLVWPLFVLLCPRRWIGPACAAGAAACLAGRIAYLEATGRTIPLYVSTHFRFDGLLVGGLCAVAMVNPTFVAVARRYATPALLVGAAFVAAVYPFTGWDKNDRNVATWGFTGLAAVSAVLVLSACLVDAGHPLRWVVGNPVVRFAGRYSYGIYATHVAVIYTVTAPLTAAARHLLHSTTLGELAAKSATVVVAVLVAVPIYWGFERPFLNLKRFFPSPGAL